MKNQKFYTMLGVMLLTLTSLTAGEPVAPEDKVIYKPSTWRPFKDVQEVLFYEGFDNQPAWIKTGKFSEEPQAPSGKGVLNLVAGKENSCTMVGTFPPQFKVPSGLNPKDITVQVAMFSDEGGTVTFKFKYGKGAYSDTAPVPKVKGWGLVTMKLSDMMEAKKRAAEPDQIITEMDITVKAPKSAKAAPKVMIDDLIFTLNANPVEVKGRLVAAEKKRTDMEKSSERDGFQYSMKINDYLKDQLKPFKGKKKAKSVLVVGGDTEQTELWVKSLAGAPKAKEGGFSFSAFDGPEAADKNMGGLADTRMFMQYNLVKNPEMVVLAIGINDAMGGGRPAEMVRVAAERALGAGSVPVVIVPAAQKTEQIAKVAEFSKTMHERCAQMGVLCVDAAHLQKNAKGELDPKSFGAVAQDKLAALAFTALKHCHDSLAKD